MSQTKTERLTGACSDIDAFAKKHDLPAEEVLALFGQVTTRLLGGSSKELDEERTQEGPKLIDNDARLLTYQGGMLARREVAFSVEALPDFHAELHAAEKRHLSVVPDLDEQLTPPVEHEAVPARSA